jgi:hypothetical protein
MDGAEPRIECAVRVEDAGWVGVSTFVTSEPVEGGWEAGWSHSRPDL